MGFFSAIKKIFGGEPGEAAPGEAAPGEVAPEGSGPVASAPAAPAVAPQGGASETAPESASATEAVASSASPAVAAQETALTLRLREASRVFRSGWALCWKAWKKLARPSRQRLLFLLRALDAPEAEAQAFVRDFEGWLARMDYRLVEEFRSELQYRLALALDLEDEEDERNRLFVKISEGLRPHAGTAGPRPGHAVCRARRAG